MERYGRRACSCRMQLGIQTPHSFMQVSKAGVSDLESFLVLCRVYLDRIVITAGGSFLVGELFWVRICFFGGGGNVDPG